MRFERSVRPRRGGRVWKPHPGRLAEWFKFDITGGNIMDKETIRNFLALAIIVAEVYYAYQNRNKGFWGVLSSQGTFVAGLLLAAVLITPIVINWLPRFTRGQVSNGSEMETLLVETFSGVSSGFAAVLDPSGASQAPAAPPTDGSAPAVPAAAPQAPAAAAPPVSAPAAQAPRVWSFPQKSGLTPMGTSLVLEYADGSGIADEVSAADIGSAGASACGWLLDGSGNPVKLVACGRSPVQVFDPGQVAGVENLPRPPAPTPAPVPTAAPPMPTPAPSIEQLAATCRQKWQAYRTSMSWFNEAAPLENFPDQSAWQLTLTKDWFRSFYSVSSSDMQIQDLEIPWDLGRALDGLTNSEGFFIGTGTMCLAQ